MTPFQIIISGLALAFCWVNLIYPKLDLPKVKPLNCCMCMSGWFGFALGLANGYCYTSILFLAIGVFIGALWEGISMRWL